MTDPLHGSGVSPGAAAAGRRRVLTVCGSLRARSSNAALLAAFGRLLPPSLEASAAPELGALPHFNPDLDGDAPPPAVVAWRNQVHRADCLVISTPEYAHALPGTFKNALDWLVSGTEIVGKPVAILQIDRGSRWAPDSLREVLATISARVVESACVCLRLGSNWVDAEQVLARPEWNTALRRAGAVLGGAATETPARQT